ncbi:Pimeloyl-ACP methyl ester carboxylesterase [Amycolatopsis xylanica]|uniref:Pimeloyl-ACP methyl ester carboxylesterase n=1 Tax=Amycolatopsis xylanica TaxID=589385 RepID=A0A1H3HDQ9_9PSEU|nr:alpha/beta hydrolase [Amycolatopsis xylanica]SDY13470.1 Pimeloyl-ACP methyl ester carboxylesterase [Amycolatopsis xylanica]
MKNLKRALAGIAAVTALVGTFAVSGSAASADTASQKAKPTVVLVHGAFADASSWTDVTKKLQRRGYQVVAPANPLRGVASDAAYLKSVLQSIDGPIVLVGHSYGGVLISKAAQDDPDVKALVYIAAFLPDAGETAGELSQGGKLGPGTINTVAYPGGTDVYIKPSAFRDVFAADVSASQAAAMAATQRPIDGSALGTKFEGAGAWHTIPSWALVASQDNAIPASAERFMAQRAHAKTVEVKASHAVSVSRPDAVADIVLDAAKSVR